MTTDMVVSGVVLLKLWTEKDVFALAGRGLMPTVRLRRARREPGHLDGRTKVVRQTRRGKSWFERLYPMFSGRI